MEANYDFSGWATRNDVKCADGRTIRKGAFADQNGKKVPLVYAHQHNSIENVLGHGILENRDEGVYMYGYFNDTEMAKYAKEAVQHGDIVGLSIYANQLKQRGGDVLHGMIREVSLVLAGANPEAYIDVPVAHSADQDDDDFEAVIYPGTEIVLKHAEKVEPEIKEEPKMEEKKVAENKERTIKDVYDEMTEEQKKVVQFMVGMALQEAKGKNNDDDEEEEEMKHNLFDNDTPNNSLSHEDVVKIFGDAKRLGSLKAAVQDSMENGALAHAVYNEDSTQQTYGMADINYLFPDYKSLNTPPEFIKRDQDWVNVIMNGVHHTPFSRIKSMFANITMDEARAKGYTKGNRKVEEVFSLLKRTTDPQTIYKKQKLDRDDVLDITSFDVVAWIKGEMRIMLDEEIARAILIGDGRISTDDDKIFENHIRPIATDDALYAIKVDVPRPVTDDQTPKQIIRYFLKNRKNYKGSGNLVFFTTEDMLSDMLLLEDGFGHALYADEAALARKLRVNKIVTVPVMENIVATTDNVTKTLVAVAVDLKDYNVGADKGGSVEMFDDFDIDYNQMKYLIETRCSGALIKPYSAMVVSIVDEETEETPEEPVVGG